MQKRQVYVFPGFPGYLHRAAVELGCPEADRAAHRITTFTALANLCSQVTAVEAKDASAILAKAMEFRNQLHVASRAADLMIDEVTQAMTASDSTMEQSGAAVMQPRKGRR